MQTPETCPRCGSEPRESNHGEAWSCGTWRMNGGTAVSQKCYERQIARLTAERDEWQRLHDLRTEQFNRSISVGAKYKQRAESAEAERDELREKLEAVEAKFREIAIVPEHDCPGDTPEICGYECLSCGESGTDEHFNHKPDCPLFLHHTP